MRLFEDYLNIGLFESFCGLFVDLSLIICDYLKFRSLELLVDYLWNLWSGLFVKINFFSDHLSSVHTLVS